MSNNPPFDAPPLVQVGFWPDPEPELDELPRRTIAEIQSEGITALIIKRLLRARHQEPGGAWAFFDEFMPGIGMASTGVGTRLDAWAMNVWPSSHYRTIAYEIKVNRGDFLRELKNPAKRDYALTYADEFYFVAPRQLIKPAELPRGCGLVEVARVGERGNFIIDGQRYILRTRVKPGPNTRLEKFRDRHVRAAWDLAASVARRACRYEGALVDDPHRPVVATPADDPNKDSDAT